MRFYSALLCLLIASNSILNVKSYGEGDNNGLPIWQERESLNMMNAVRIDPKGYMSYFMSTGYNNLGNVLNIYPATNPVYYNSVLNGQARYHSQDMAVNGCFSHNDCDGGTIANRFASFNSGCPSGWGENLSAGLTDGVSTQNQLICETVPNCVNDGVNDGHRSNMMNANWVTAGAGFYYSSSSAYRAYWSQDYKSATCEPQSSPIYSGSHSFYNSYLPNYMAVYYNSKGETLQSANIFFGSGGSANLKLIVGSTNKGLYSYIPNSYISCDTYVFEFVTSNGKVYRYPDTGALSVVTNAGSCTAWVSTYIAGSATTAPPATQAPTTAPPATQAPTTEPPATQAPSTTTTSSSSGTSSNAGTSSSSSGTSSNAGTSSSSATSSNAGTSSSSGSSNAGTSSSSGSSNAGTSSSSGSTSNNSGETSNESNSNQNSDNKSNDGSNQPGGINASNDVDESSDSYQIIPNLIVPVLLGAFIKLILL